jgi:hypothetical protein
MTLETMATSWTPPRRLDERPDGCRLSLVGVTHGDGTTLQEAADDLVSRLLGIAMAFRSGLRASSELGPPDRRLLEFVWELGELAAAGKDIRERIFGLGPGPDAPD